MSEDGRAGRSRGRAGRAADSDPGSRRRRVEEATGLLAATAAALTDAQARGPSLLPGWSRGHVLTHIARNADGLRNLLIWARTGIEVTGTGRRLPLGPASATRTRAAVTVAGPAAGCWPGSPAAIPGRG